MSDFADLTRRQRLLFIAFCMVGVPLITLFLIEGASSSLIFLHEVFSGDDHRVADRHYTQYDPELGWAPRPNVDLPDVYGPGVGVQINEQGFRQNGPIAVHPAPGRRRLICSGDSFTFGYGVDNSETWCSRLESEDPTLETVNMAVVGYGVDQMYLRFRRDAESLDYQVHVVAFIEHDFKRMGPVRLLGADKPRLAIWDGKLSVENTPVPKRWYTPGWWLRAARAASELGTSELFSRLRPSPREETGAEADSVIWETAQLVFDDLLRLSTRKGAELVLVYLPSQPDFDLRTSAWRQAVREFAAARPIRYLDLGAEFMQLPADSMRAFFRPVDGHYSSGAQHWVAKRIHAFLEGTPALTASGRGSLSHRIRRRLRGRASR